ncbi:hypothetical protein ACLGI4_04160 [Streptomyces sp. HMX112]|uniref:hypothetical protein n=1 Tax=Streptomyces sp. HMX112 TaxID=3390850 RepID=UPI003A801DBF
MGLLAALVTLLLPPALLGVVLAMGRYEERMLPEPPPEGDTAPATSRSAGRAGRSAPAGPAHAAGPRHARRRR